MFKILLYYIYIKIENPEDLRLSQRALCEKSDLLGRILISKEGINGTVCGEEKKVDEYITETKKYHGLEDLEFKVSYNKEQVFEKLRILVRDEIVTLGLKARSQKYINKNADVNLKNKAKYIEPEELLNLYDNKEEFYVVDARNEYEARIGRFRNSIFFNIDNFRELPEAIKEIDHLKEKKVVTICTGGVRCEKASALLIEKGFKNVNQLHGGIHVYGDKVGGKYFDGEMYVFDKRIHIPVNKVDPTIISKCHFCEIEIARYINCANDPCAKRIIVCEECDKVYNGCCSRECEALI